MKAFADSKQKRDSFAETAQEKDKYEIVLKTASPQAIQGHRAAFLEIRLHRFG
jgi:hypothetical protein